MESPQRVDHSHRSEIAGLIGVPYERFQEDDPELRKVFDNPAEPPVGIEALRALHPGLRSFATFLAEVAEQSPRT